MTSSVNCTVHVPKATKYRKKQCCQLSMTLEDVAN